MGNTGEPQRYIILEPIEDPETAPMKEPSPHISPDPSPSPILVPARENEPVPA